MMSLPILPPELIEEILSWLPVKLLVRLTCVCKPWKSLIFDPRFAKLHLERSPKHTHTLLTLIDGVEESETWVVGPQSVRRLLEYPASTVVNEDNCYRFTDSKFFAIGSANGLVCLIGDKSIQRENRQVYSWLWNPSLRLTSGNSPTLSFMNPNLWVHLGFGYDHSGDTYKVSQFSI